MVESVYIGYSGGCWGVYKVQWGLPVCIGYGGGMVVMYRIQQRMVVVCIGYSREWWWCI